MVSGHNAGAVDCTYQQRVGEADLRNQRDSELNQKTWDELAGVIKASSGGGLAQAAVSGGVGSFGKRAR